jgi:hypothetical protein
MLIGYSLSLAHAFRAMLFTRRETKRIESEEFIGGYFRRSSRVIMPDPGNTASQVFGVVAAWLGLCVFVTLFGDPWAAFRGEVDDILRIGFALLSLCFLPWAFYSVESGGYDAAIFSDGGIVIRQIRTGSESRLSWGDVNLFTYSVGEGGFSYYFRAGKLLINVGNGGDRDRAIIDMVVKHVPQSKWHGAEMARYLREHFGIEVDKSTRASSD